MQDGSISKIFETICEGLRNIDGVDLTFFHSNPARHDGMTIINPDPTSSSPRWSQSFRADLDFLPASFISTLSNSSQCQVDSSENCIHIQHEDGTHVCIVAECISSLYPFSWNLFLTAKKKPLTDAASMSQLRDLVLSTLCLILVNPECQTAMNMRKHLLRMNHLDPIIEFHLTTFLLSKHPKRMGLWAHRLFLVKEYLLTKASHNACTSASTEKMTRKDLYQWLIYDWIACERAGRNYKCNYTSWTYRLQILNLLITNQEMNPPDTFLLDELQNVKLFISSSNLDSSAWHYYHRVLSIYLDKLNEHKDRSSSSNELISSEWEWIRSRLITAPKNQLIWNRLRQFLQEFVSFSHLERLLSSIDIEEERRWIEELVEASSITREMMYSKYSNLPYPGDIPVECRGPLSYWSAFLQQRKNE